MSLPKKAFPWTFPLFTHYTFKLHIFTQFLHHDAPEYGEVGGSPASLRDGGNRPLQFMVYTLKPLLDSDNFYTFTTPTYYMYDTVLHDANFQCFMGMSVPMSIFTLYLND